MARQVHTAVVAPGKWPTDGVALTFLAADVANKEQTVLTGKELLIAHNDDASAHTVTITSVDDPYKRTGDITADSIAAGAYHTYGPLALTGWQQTDGNLYFEADNANVMFAVIRLP